MARANRAPASTRRSRRRCGLRIGALARQYRVASGIARWTYHTLGRGEIFMHSQDAMMIMNNAGVIVDVCFISIKYVSGI